MLKAEGRGFWKNKYDLLHDGVKVACWDPSMWSTGGSFTLDGRSYRVRANGWGTKYTMTDDQDAVHASAVRVGRKNWTVEADGRVYEFQRTSSWRNDQQLVHNGIPVGTIKRRNSFSSKVEADLPGLPLPVQIFVLGVLISLWNSQAAAAAA
ncbi:hypothetical protein [Actinoplanes sp. DH11]|uniref:hypothetical protein n=1 Tax=Actinoplanes sp. DH11 TaxID=2857011 RepID=UPI001E379594|nr:hypothetical protein [Actinoplanes sp. DH11]